MLRILLLVVMAVGCTTEDTVYADLNLAAEDCLQVEVRGLDSNEDPGSNAGDIQKADGAKGGAWSVTPAIGPVNTVHLFEVVLDADLDASTDRVLVVSDNNNDGGDGGVGPTEWVLDPVGGQTATYDVPLASGGEDGATRTDTFCIHVQRQEQ